MAKCRKDMSQRNQVHIIGPDVIMSEIHKLNTSISSIIVKYFDITWSALSIYSQASHNVAMYCVSCFVLYLAWPQTHRVESRSTRDSANFLSLPCDFSYTPSSHLIQEEGSFPIFLNVSYLPPFRPIRPHLTILMSICRILKEWPKRIIRIFGVICQLPRSHSPLAQYQ